MCWCQNGKCLECRNSYFALLASSSSGGLLPQNCSTKSIQWSLSRIPVTRRPPNHRHSIIFMSCIVIVISPHRRWKVWVSGLHLWVFNSIQEVFLIQTMRQINALYFTKRVSNHTYRQQQWEVQGRGSVAQCWRPGRSQGSRYGRYRSSQRCGWCVRSLRGTKSSWSSDRRLARRSLS